MLQPIYHWFEPGGVRGFFQPSFPVRDWLVVWRSEIKTENKRGKERDTQKSLGSARLHPREGVPLFYNPVRRQYWCLQLYCSSFLNPFLRGKFPPNSLPTCSLNLSSGSETTSGMTSRAKIRMATLSPDWLLIQSLIFETTDLRIITL